MTKEDPIVTDAKAMSAYLQTLTGVPPTLKDSVPRLLLELAEEVNSLWDNLHAREHELAESDSALTKAKKDLAVPEQIGREDWPAAYQDALVGIAYWEGEADRLTACIEAPWTKGEAPDVLGEDGVIYGCAVCGEPTETIPCAKHQWARA